jgi:peptide/nickel transport system substrate-binding protein
MLSINRRGALGLIGAPPAALILPRMSFAQGSALGDDRRAEDHHNNTLDI